MVLTYQKPQQITVLMKSGVLIEVSITHILKEFTLKWLLVHRYFTCVEKPVTVEVFRTGTPPRAKVLSLFMFLEKHTTLL